MAISIPIVTTYDAKGIDKASRDIKRAEGGWAKAGAGIKAAAKPAAVGLAALAGAGFLAVKSGEQAATAQAALDKVFSNMGYAENAQAAADYASELEALTGIDDKAIKGAQTKLATFKDVAADTELMARTTELAADLMSAGYGDMETQAQGLGKALADPSKGMALLVEQGALTSDEMKAIGDEFARTGDKAAAQEAILASLEKQVGGVATATADDSDKIAQATGNVSEAFGLALLPALQTVTPWLLKIADWAKNNSGPLLAIATAIGAVAAAVLVINAVMKVWAAISAVVSAVNLVLGTSFTLALGPVLLVIAAIAAVIAIGILLYKNWDKISAFLKRTWEAIKRNATRAFKAIKDFIARTWAQIKSGLTAAWNAIKAVFKGVLKAIETVVRTYLNIWKAIISAVFKAIKAIFSTYINGWKALIKAGLEAAKTIIRTVMNIIKAVFRGDWAAVVGIVKDKINALLALVRGIPGRVSRALGNLGRLLYNKGRDLVQGLINGIKSLLGSLGNVVGGIVDKINPFSRATSSVSTSSVQAGTVSLARTSGVAARSTTSTPASSRVTVNIMGGDPFRAGSVIKRMLEGRRSFADAVSARREVHEPVFAVGIGQGRNLVLNAISIDIAGQ